jgi:hypothetical protein
VAAKPAHSPGSQSLWRGSSIINNLKSTHHEASRVVLSSLSLSLSRCVASRKQKPCLHQHRCLPGSSRVSLYASPASSSASKLTFINRPPGTILKLQDYAAASRPENRRYRAGSRRAQVRSRNPPSPPFAPGVHSPEPPHGVVVAKRCLYHAIFLRNLTAFEHISYTAHF